MIIYQVRYNYEVFIIWSNLILLLLGIGIVLSFNVRLVNYQFMYNTKTIIEYETFSFYCLFPLPRFVRLGPATHFS